MRSIDMGLKDWLNVLAVALSPLIAVQVTAWLSDRKERRARKQRLFETLMTTRASLGPQLGSSSPDHVRALTMIDIEFHGDKKATAIIAAWRAYRTQLNTRPANTEQGWNAWGEKRNDLLCDLLFALAQYLGYGFDRTLIKSEAYVPDLYNQNEFKAARIRDAVLGIVEGQQPLWFTADKPEPKAPEVP